MLLSRVNRLPKKRSRVHGMATIQHVNKARKDQGRCVICTEKVLVGQPYNWFQANRFAPRYVWHDTCPAPRGSVLESNEKRSTAMAAFEGAYDEVDAIRNRLSAYQEVPEGRTDEDGTWTPETAAESLLDDLGAVSAACAEGVNSAAEMWRESASNIEDGFGQATTNSDEMNERADEWEQVATDIETLRDEVDEWDASQWVAEDEADPWIGWTEWAESVLDSFTELLGDQEGTLS
jgi:hypothetical protein